MNNNKNQKGFAPIIVIIVFIILAGVVGGGLYLKKKQNAKNIACTQEAKQCPDGSAVGRTGPNCEFAACPASETSTWKTYRNEKYGFEVKYPQDWYIPSNRPGSSFYIVGFCSTAAKSVCKNKNVPGYFGDVVLDLVKSPFSQENFNQYCKTNFEQSKSYSNGVIENKGSYSLCRLPGLETPFKSVYIFYNSVLFAMYRHQESFSISPVIYPVSEADFEKILSTFKFTAPSASATGTLSGKVSIGPICPVVRIDVPCPPSPEAYASREFLVLESSKKEVARFHADTQGNYSVSVSPGTYTVVSAKTGIGFLSKGLPSTVTIKAGQTTTLNIDVDTGIR